MTIHTTVKIHNQGPALWPEQKPLAEVLQIKRTTPETIWQATYQCNPVAPEGTIFRQEYFLNSRYDSLDPRLVHLPIAIFQSWDTAIQDKDDSAFSALTEGALMPDYRLFIRKVWQSHLGMPELVDAIAAHAQQANRGLKLRAVVIEAKASGISAVQTLKKAGPLWLRTKLKTYDPTHDKPTRAGQAAVWCKNGMVWLPHPADNVPWLFDFEADLFAAPALAYWDMIDSFSQLVLYLQNYLEAGLVARTESVPGGLV